MAESLVQSLLTKLGELALLEAQLQLGIGDDIKFIKDELSTMKAFLTDADRRSARGEVVSEWVAQVRDESFKVEDILDEFLLRMELLKFRKPMGCIDIKCYISYVPRIFRQLLVRHRFHSEIESIKKEIEDISKRREQYNLQEEGTSSAIIGEETGEDLGAASPFVEEADIVGIEKDVKQLKEWLLNEEKEKQRAIISVVGMGGLGKTTLVKRVYKIIEVQFDCHAWVYVSQTFNMTDILKRILEGFCNSRNEPTPSGLETMNEEELREKILIYLQRKRYVLVLDDIWDIYVWDGLKHALPVEGNGRIIFTTRMENVASPLNENYYIHKHEPLPHEIAWELFCKKAFRSSTPPGICPGYLQELADAMLRKCNGLPLAVVTLGGLMSRKGVTVIEWRDMLKNLDWELCHNQDLKRLNRVLITSYSHLPAYLKYCFLYCGMFPEDFEIDREKLIRLWVAEGFIEEHPRKTPEEVANECFMQLIDRSILQAIFSDGEGEIRACRMHDLMRDIAIYMFEKEEFAMIITNEDNEIERGSRRVAVQNTLSTGEFPSNMSSWNVRSFLIFNIKQSLSSSSLISQVLWGFNLLRVLDLEGFKIQHLPEEIGHLIHLRYLGLKRTKIKELPASLEKLRVLQTLDVRYTNLRTLPRGIILLKNLRHLLLFSRHNPISLPTGSSSLKRLQTLNGVVLDEISARELNWLTQLRTLLITEVKGDGELCRELCVSINKMKHLRSLTISSSQNINIQLEKMSSPPIYLQELTLEGTMSKFPSWFASLNCITKLNLSNSRLKSEPFSILSQLPNLQTLFLLNAYTGKKVGYGGRNGFWKLRKLVIIGMKELEEWREVEPGTLLNLRFIVIATCPKLMKLPRGFEHLTALESLELGEMPVSFVDRLRRGGEDHWMVKHIPRIKIVQVMDECLVFDFLT